MQFLANTLYLNFQFANKYNFNISTLQPLFSMQIYTKVLQTMQNTIQKKHNQLIKTNLKNNRMGD